MTITISPDRIETYIGYESEPSPWHRVTQAQINQFADCTLDRQFIHVDPERARATPYGSTIAHGFLTMSMLVHFTDRVKLSIEGSIVTLNAGFDRVRFLSPVKVDKCIRGHFKIVEINATKPGHFRIKTHVTVEIEAEESPALVAEWITVQVVK